MKDPSKAEKSAHIERTIRKCALETHQSGDLRILAKDIGCTPRVFYYWISRARIPNTKAQLLESRFGKDIADASTLTR
jgi:hypothetical protein